MITISFVDLAQLFLLTTISFGVNGWLALELYRDWAHKKALSKVKWVLDPATLTNSLSGTVSGHSAQPNAAPQGVYPTGRYM